MVKYTGRGLVVKGLGVLSKVQMLNLVLGVGVFFLLPIIGGWKPSSTLQQSTRRETRFYLVLLLGGPLSFCQFIGPATTQNLVVKFDGEICSGVLVENASDDFPGNIFPQQKKLENPIPNFAGSSPPISPKTSPTSLWKSLVLKFTPPPAFK